MAKQLIRIPEMAAELSMTESALRKALSKGLSGKTVPPSKKLGAKVVFLRAAVDAWYGELSRQSMAECGLHNQPDEKNNPAGRKPKRKPTPAERRAEMEG